MKYIISIVFTITLTIGSIYAIDNITTLTQTANTGDKITSDWVNAVNAAIGPGGGHGCVTPPTSLAECQAILSAGAVKTYKATLIGNSFGYVTVQPNISLALCAAGTMVLYGDNSSGVKIYGGASGVSDYSIGGPLNSTSSTIDKICY